MTPVLLLPAALAALAAVMLPLAIHIARRSEQRPTDFAALRWLSAKPRPRSRLRLDEVLLLVLRVLLVALVVLVLARPALRGGAGEGRPVVVISGADPARAPLTAAELQRARWLAPGFPPVDRGAVAGTQPVASLIRELDAGLPPGADLTIVAPSVLQGVDGERPRLARPVRWIVTPGTMPEPRAAAAGPLRPVLRHDAAHAAEARYLRAALQALDPAGSLPNEGDLAGPLPDSPGPVIRLAAGAWPEPVTAFVRSGGTLLVSADSEVPARAGPAVALWPDAEGTAQVEARGLGAGQVLRFTRPLRPARMPALLDGDLPARLQALLAPPRSAPARALAADHAPLSTGSVAPTLPLQDLRPWLALLIVGLALAERWLATARTRAPGP
ncbi:BatA domain-containing protein [Novosphingobium flavum]|uniref:BatA domain-containing protein n=1 Tax=Novosphingobium aerophilum TaxID=2839843 RepID=A0A7X1KBL0_9SPHN|nr:BatA domain-containing protein [Novosphingobium aerophilum]MBC2651318.1 BatA domain-containing protein [Novosphingobium aerophilum]MBC2661216.1 BatA domain-containing protein [Novosphingobium aerophilum]